MRTYKPAVGFQIWLHFLTTDCTTAALVQRIRDVMTSDLPNAYGRRRDVIPGIGVAAYDQSRSRSWKVGRFTADWVGSASDGSPPPASGVRSPSSEGEPARILAERLKRSAFR